MGMKTFILIVYLIPSFMMAQIDLPTASPDAAWTHQVGFTQIELSYSRPHMRNRKIFGALVPYDVLWRTGAGESTRIKFSEDIVFGGKLVSMGKKYLLFVIAARIRSLDSRTAASGNPTIVIAGDVSFSLDDRRFTSISTIKASIP